MIHPRLFILLLPLSLFAQELAFEIGPPQIGINEAVSFAVVIKGQSTGRSPSFVGGMKLGDFELANPIPARSSQTSIFNGRVESEERFTYYLKPTKKGNLTVPAQKLKYNGKEYASNATTVEVGEENRSVGRRRSSRFNDPFDDLRRRRNTRQEAELFVTLEVPKTEYYIGEPVPVEIVLYRTPGVSITNEGSSFDLPDFKDFWVEDGQGDSREHYETVNGKRYIAYTIIRKRMYPNRTGKIAIPAAEFVLNVSVGGGFFADWNRVKRATEPVELNIKPLPSQGRPADFSGLVGSFKIEGKLDTQTIKVGETANLEITVSGKGNFAALNNLKPQLPASFEAFEGGSPVVEKTNQMATKTWQTALVPKREGAFEIKLPALSFFDLEKRAYRTAEAPALTLEVFPGPGLGGPTAPVTGGDRPFVAEQNLSYIKLGDLNEEPGPAKLHPPKNLMWLAAGFIGLDLLVFLGLWTRNNLAGRRVELRPKYAWSNFRKRLAQLEKQNDNEAFHAGLSEAVLAYFGDKWERAGQGISLEFIHDRFHRDGLDDALYRKVEECIEACDLARFTPGSPASREQTLEKTRKTIEEIEGAMS